MTDILSNMSVTDQLWFFLPKILVAALCGGMVGLERELKHRAAGMKTNIMICVGSTLFAATSFLIFNIHPEVDPTRIVSYIVSGIGFLGAGAIFRSEQKIMGLTSASLIWILGAIGIIIAAGGYIISPIITVGLVATTVTISKFEKKYL